MVPKLAATAILLLLAFTAFFSPSGCDNCQQHLGAPFGILFALIAAIVWFKWESIREGFHDEKNGSELPIIRLGAKSLAGLASLLHRSLQRPPSRT